MKLSEIGEKFELCKIYSKTSSHLVVSVQMATKFNEKVAIDLNNGMIVGYYI